MQTNLHDVVDTRRHPPDIDTIPLRARNLHIIPTAIRSTHADNIKASNLYKLPRTSHLCRNSHPVRIVAGGKENKNRTITSPPTISKYLKILFSTPYPILTLSQPMSRVQLPLGLQEKLRPQSSYGDSPSGPPAAWPREGVVLSTPGLLSLSVGGE